MCFFDSISNTKIQCPNKGILLLFQFFFCFLIFQLSHTFVDILCSSLQMCVKDHMGILSYWLSNAGNFAVFFVFCFLFPLFLPLHWPCLWNQFIYLFVSVITTLHLFMFGFNAVGLRVSPTPSHFSSNPEGKSIQPSLQPSRDLMITLYCTVLYRFTLGKKRSGQHDSTLVYLMEKAVDPIVIPLYPHEGE